MVDQILYRFLETTNRLIGYSVKVDGTSNNEALTGNNGLVTVILELLIAILELLIALLEYLNFLYGSVPSAVVEKGKIL